MNWDRKLWGVEFRSRGCSPILIGSAWCDFTKAPAYSGEPTRALLFQTRKDARAWLDKFERYPKQLHIVRVRETVKRA